MIPYIAANAIENILRRRADCAENERRKVDGQDERGDKKAVSRWFFPYSVWEYAYKDDRIFIQYCDCEVSK